jgi:hypothetical protein
MGARTRTISSRLRPILVALFGVAAGEPAAAVTEGLTRRRAAHSRIRWGSCMAPP